MLFEGRINLHFVNTVLSKHVEHWFLIAPFACSSKLFLGSLSRLAEKNMQTFKVFKIGILARSFSSHAIFNIHNFKNKQEKYYSKRHKRITSHLRNVPKNMYF